jgi:pilus assembly protein CpaB
MNRTSRFVVVLLVAIGAAAVAAFAVFRAVSSIPTREVEVATVPAVVAARQIPVGVVLTKDDVKLVPWPAKSPVTGGFSQVDGVVNRGAISALAENEPVTETKLAPVGAGGGLPPTIPEGMRAISVRTNEVIGVAGFVVPGTRVDVVVTVKVPSSQDSVSRVVLSNVQVLTAGTRYDQEKAKEDGKPIPTSVVTLLVTPDDAERLTLASNEGQIMLTLRNPMDVAPTSTPGVRMASLMGPPSAPVVQKVEPNRRIVVRAKAPEPPPPAPKPYTVETIRAAKRSEEPVR